MIYRNRVDYHFSSHINVVRDNTRVLCDMVCNIVKIYIFNISSISSHTILRNYVFSQVDHSNCTKPYIHSSLCLKPCFGFKILGYELYMEFSHYIAN